MTEVEAQSLEGLLTRKASDLRRGVLTILLNQKDPPALASADRLLAAPSAPQRVAGLELLRRLAEDNRSVATVKQRAKDFRAARTRVTAEEDKHLDVILGAEHEVATLENGLGLLDPDRKTRPAVPRTRKVQLVTPAAKACLKALDKLVHAHRETPITVLNYLDKEEEVLLGNAEWRFPWPDSKLEVRQDIERLPLREVWEQWLDDRPDACRDEDGLELLRAIGILAEAHAGSVADVERWLKQHLQRITRDDKTEQGKL